MLSPLLLTAVLAAAPGRELPDAELVVRAPSVQRAQGLAAFLDRAGRHAPTLGTWQQLVYPLLADAALSPERLAALGGAGDASLTGSVRGPQAMACLTLADPATFEAQLGRRLERFGTPTPVALKGLDGGRQVEDGEGRVQGFARRKGLACTWTAPAARATQAAREALQALQGRPAKSSTAPGLDLVFAGGRARADGSAQDLRVEGTAASPRALPLLPPGASPYANVAVRGTSQVALRLEPRAGGAALTGALRRLAQLCAGCDRAVLQQATQRLAGQLTGAALLRVGTFRPTNEGLRSTLGRYRALPFALLAQHQPGTGVSTALASLRRLPGVTASEDGVILPLGGQASLHLGARDGHLYAASSAELARELLADAAAPKAAGRLAHGAVVTADAPALARALDRVPLLEVLAVPELAALMALSHELGPLLGRTERLTLGLDRTGSARTVAFDARWELVSGPTAGP